MTTFAVSVLVFLVLALFVSLCLEANAHNKTLGRLARCRRRLKESRDERDWWKVGYYEGVEAVEAVERERRAS